jgi:glutathione peroxidase
MKLILASALFLTLTATTTKTKNYAIGDNSAPGKNIYDFRIKSLDGGTIDFSQFKGKKILIVNTASKCGFTPQYAALEKLYEQYKDKLVIVGFPSADFGDQEYHNDTDIHSFCQKNYGVTFPLTTRVDVKGDNTTPVYKYLCNKTENGVLDATISWNFNKFLIDEAGNWVRWFPSQVLPNDTAIVNWILKPNIYTGISANTLPLQFTCTNPVNERLSFNLNNNIPQNISIKLFSISGDEVGTIYNGNAGEFLPVDYNVAGLSSGVYLMQIQSAATRQIMKVVVAH